MQVVGGDVVIEDVESFLDELRSIGDRHECVVQAIDGRSVAGPGHLEQAVELAQRERRRGASIVDDPGLEILLYVAGTRQIDRALELGVSPGENQLAIVVVGEAERAGADAVRELIDGGDELPEPDEQWLCDWYEITDAERAATTGSLENLVCERVALLVVER